jgi:hypothetical protein
VVRDIAIPFDDEFSPIVREIFRVSHIEGQLIRTEIGEIFGKFKKYPIEGFGDYEELKPKLKQNKIIKIRNESPYK